MAEDDLPDLTAGSVEGFLVALADSIQQAQRQLTERSVNLAPGQPAVTYQLPKIEFEFRTSFEFGSSDQELRMRSVSTSSEARSTSMIRGSFVAVPAQGGKPPPVVTLEMQRVSANNLSIAVHVSSADGEPMEGVPVEFNIDKTRSGADLSADTHIWDGALPTKADGVARTNLRVAADEEPNQKIFVIVDALSETHTVIFEYEPD